VTGACVEDGLLLVLDQYTDAGWGPSDPSGSQPADGPLPTPNYRPGPAYSTHIKIVQYVDKYLPIPNGTYKIDKLPVGENWQYDDDHYMVYSTNSQSVGKDYDVQAREPGPSVDDLGRSREVADDDQSLQRDLAVPRNFPASVRLKVQQLTANAKGFGAGPNDTGNFPNQGRGYGRWATAACRCATTPTAASRWPRGRRRRASSAAARTCWSAAS